MKIVNNFLLDIAPDINDTLMIFLSNYESNYSLLTKNYD